MIPSPLLADVRPASRHAVGEARDHSITGITHEGMVHEGMVMDQPSLDEWIVGQLHQHGCQPLEQLVAPLRQVNWSELFLAIHRLVRASRICLWPGDTGDVVLSLAAKATGSGVYADDLVRDATPPLI